MDQTVVELTEDTKPWYKSRTMIGSVVATVAIIAGLAGFEIDGALEAEVADTLFESIALGGVVFGLVGRVLATKRLS